MDESVVIEDIQICSCKNALCLHGLLPTCAEEDWKQKIKLQEGENWPRKPTANDLELYPKHLECICMAHQDVLYLQCDRGWS